jgi:hypothetical protein
MSLALAIPGGSIAEEPPLGIPFATYLPLSGNLAQTLIRHGLVDQRRPYGSAVSAVSASIPTRGSQESRFP